MKTYIYRCETRLGGWLSVEVDAASEGEAISIILAKGYKPICRVYQTSPWL